MPVPIAICIAKSPIEIATIPILIIGAETLFL
jgi:hypothetical protein